MGIMQAVRINEVRLYLCMYMWYVVWCVPVCGVCLVCGGGVCIWYVWCVCVCGVCVCVCINALISRVVFS